MLRSLRFRLPALFLAGIVVSGLVAAIVAFQLFQSYTLRRAKQELRREATGVTRIYSAQATGSNDPVPASQLEEATGDRIYYVPISRGIDLFPGDPRPRSEIRVVAAMSGGVDSSVVAALLKYAGYDVVGVTLQLYDFTAALKKQGACCAGQDIHDAKRVAETLHISHYMLDYEERFKHAVIDRFADSYAAGETPVPCVT